ncbi:MAG: tRNA pseudouridine(55) synthase TruB, partial [Panacagrimonas sp.]
MSKATNAGRGKIQWRDIDGILLLDKPVGLSSNQALQQVRRLFRARKAGHTGSLDPLASGMLPICLGQATKLCGQLLASDKRYRTVIRLGRKTNTGDAEGTVVEQSNPVDLSRARIEQTLQGFVGAIQQVPPMYSALKHEGQRLYDLARKGVEVQRQARTVQIHAIELLGWQSPDLEVEVHCSKGTYIRVLGEDIA